MLLFDFRCQSCNKLTEGFARSADVKAQIECKECGDQAVRIISPVRCKLDGTDPGFPDAWDKWAKMHEQGAKEKEV